MSEARKQWIIGSVMVATMILLAAASVWFYVQSRPPKIDLAYQLRQLQPQLRVPLYVPASLPADYEVVSGSVGFLEEGVAGFTMRYKDKELFIAQQARPPLMEEVNKKEQFTTPGGKAYIADLNGKLTGFLVTQQTLIIVSSPDKVGSAQLKEILQSIRKI